MGYIDETESEYETSDDDNSVSRSLLIFHESPRHHRLSMSRQVSFVALDAHEESVESSDASMNRMLDFVPVAETIDDAKDDVFKRANPISHSDNYVAHNLDMEIMLQQAHPTPTLQPALSHPSPLLPQTQQIQIGNGVGA